MNPAATEIQSWVLSISLICELLSEKLSDKFSQNRFELKLTWSNLSNLLIPDVFAATISVSRLLRSAQRITDDERSRESLDTFLVFLDSLDLHIRMLEVVALGPHPLEEFRIAEQIDVGMWNSWAEWIVGLLTLRFHCRVWLLVDQVTIVRLAFILQNAGPVRWDIWMCNENSSSC